MPRPRRRVCLEEGLRLDLTLLMRWGFLRPGLKVGPNSIGWTHSYAGYEVASGEITALKPDTTVGYTSKLVTSSK
jgi:hypothetical protein